jgi:hypothetical protein
MRGNPGSVKRKKNPRAKGGLRMPGGEVPTLMVSRMEAFKRALGAGLEKEQVETWAKERRNEKRLEDDEAAKRPAALPAPESSRGADEAPRDADEAARRSAPPPASESPRDTDEAPGEPRSSPGSRLFGGLFGRRSG